MSSEDQPVESLALLIPPLRGQRVMLSTDLARLYGVPGKALIQAVSRNAARFPADFMFRHTRAEIRDRSRFVTCAPILRARYGSRRVRGS